MDALAMGLLMKESLDAEEMAAFSGVAQPTATSRYLSR